MKPWMRAPRAVARVVFDLKSKDGLAIVKSMAAKSDVLVESFRPGVMKRLGLDPPRLKRLAPKLLFAPIPLPVLVAAEKTLQKVQS